MNNPTLTEFCFGMIGRADIEGSKSNVAMNAWLPQASSVIDSIPGAHPDGRGRAQGPVTYRRKLFRPPAACVRPLMACRRLHLLVGRSPYLKPILEMDPQLTERWAAFLFDGRRATCAALSVKGRIVVLRIASYR